MYRMHFLTLRHLSKMSCKDNSACLDVKDQDNTREGGRLLRGLEIHFALKMQFP